MGGLNIEVFRMSVYIFAPIAAFYFCNLPEFYREQVVPMMVTCYTMHIRRY